MSAGFDFWSPNDRVVVLDFNNDGRDDVFVYRPGGGPAYAMQGNANQTFTTTMAASNFAGFDFGEPQDRAFAFDYDNDGYKDLFFYRPLSSVAWVARSNGTGTFSQAYGATGIGGYFPNSILDQVRVLDYDGDGRDDLFFFRPGGGWASLIHNTSTGFVGGAPSSGFLGFDFGDPLDEVLVLDYNGDTRDDLLMYRPGTGAAYLARGTSTGMTLTTATTGIGGYDILDRWDTAVKFDFNNDTYDDLFFYRPGLYASYVLQGNGAGGFSVAYGGMGIGGTWAYDFSKHQDKVVVLDHDNDSRDDLYLYRTDSFRQVQSLSNGQFSAFYPDSAIAPW